MYNAFSREELNYLEKESNLKFASRRPLIQARKDIKNLKKGKCLEMNVICWNYKTDETILKCVRFVLNDINVSSVSWGTKKVLSQTRGEITLPKLTRKVRIAMMYRRYKEFAMEHTDCIHKSCFYYIVGVITSNDNAMLFSVDYVTSMLVNKSAETLEDIVDSLVPLSKKEDISKMIAATTNILKHQYKSHVAKNDEVCFHGIVYALTKDKEHKQSIDCNTCKFPLFLCNYLKKVIEETKSNENHHDLTCDDAFTVVDNIKDKFSLYLAHQTRCKCQQTSISHMEDMSKSTCLESNGKVVKALVIMDFKMKFEVRSARESQVQHFGKRVIGWHGMAVIFYLLDENGEAQRNIVYLDQILDDSNKQDAGTVIALLEAGLSAIHRQLPFISEITLLSDNAKCYQNHFLIMQSVIRITF